MSRHRQPFCETLETRQLLAAGALDKSFSGDGKATFDLGGGVIMTAADVAVQSDGKTVVVGASRDSATSQNFRAAVARFSLDGTPDKSFGNRGNGSFLFNIGDANDDRLTAVAIQGDGKIVVAGFSGTDGLFGETVQCGVARFNTNGTLDTTFSGDGKRTIDFGSFATDVIIQQVGTVNGIVEKILVVGTNDPTFGNDDFAIARLNPDGLLDGTFSGDGKAEIGFGDDDNANAVALDSQGRIILVGDSARFIALTRLQGGNGAKDTTFGDGGTVIRAFAGSASTRAQSVLIQGDKIVVAGTARPVAGSAGNFFLARFLSTGSLDLTFGASGSGFVTTDFGGNDVASDLIRSADGGLIVGGSSGGKFALASYTANGVPRTNFGVNGKLLPGFGNDEGGGGNVGIAKGPGRRFTVAGGRSFVTARFLDDGANVVFVAATDRSASENISDTATLIVGRTERLPVPTRIFFNVGGTATRPGSTSFGTSGNSDYSVSRMTLVDRNGAQVARPFVDIPANETFVTCTLTAVNDTALEGPETAIFTIAPDASYAIGTPSNGTITIADNDQPPVLNFAPNADAFVRDGTFATTNFGVATELQVKTSSSVGLNREAFFKFDVRTISSVGSAKLQVFAKVSDTQNASIQTNVLGLPDSTWSETAITFNNRPPLLAAVSTQTIAGTTLKLYEFDVTAYLLKERSLTHDLVSFVLKNPNSSESFVIVNSREATSGRPVLRIDASPQVGTTRLATSLLNTAVGKLVPVAVPVEWAVPQGSWRQLSNIQLRLRGKRGSEILINWNEADNTFALFDPMTGRFGEPMKIGTDAVLSNSLVNISLKRSSVAARGPTSSKVTVTFSLQFKGPIQRWTIDAAASNDLGSQTRFVHVG
ncbi:hypothetical protein BH09PLA1_BH09PLA1_19210 [soil metagenome]